MINGGSKEKRGWEDTKEIRMKGEKDEEAGKEKRRKGEVYATEVWRKKAGEGREAI